MDFAVQFWGVRGKVATPGKDTVRYGGNTACLEMRVGNQRLVFDSGTGVRKLGNSLLSQMPVEIHLFFTHCHWDRIQGFPFLVPAFIPGNRFHIYGVRTTNGASFEELLEQQMTPPNFPVPIQVMQSEIKFYNLSLDKKQCLGDVYVETVALNHVNSSVGYRINWQEWSVVYATDIGYYSAELSPRLLDIVNGVDLLILDAPKFLQGKEDVSIQSLLKLIETSRAKRVVISSYNPEHDDDFLERLEKKLQNIFPHTSLAREGMVVELTS
ncbi:MAG: MBL fold metallo-hydrolase [Okeania sp. SIO2D1]|nr:MBL fold metallo-hydrolase [Okeania sp. SIO2D1]